MTVSPEPSRQVPHHAPPKQRLHIVTDLSQQVVSTLLSGVRYTSRVQRNNHVKIKFESPEDAREADRRIQRTSGLNFTYSRGLKELLHGPQQGLRRRPNRRPSRSTVADHGPDDGSNGSASSRGHTHASAPIDAAGPEDQQQQQQLDASTPAYQPHQPSPRADATPFQPAASSHTPQPTPSHQPTQPGPGPATSSYAQQGSYRFLSSFNPQQQQQGGEQGGFDPSGSRRYGGEGGQVPMGTHSHRGPSYFPHLGGSFPPQPQPQPQPQQQKQQQDPPHQHLLGGPPPGFPFSTTPTLGGMHGDTPAPWGRNADAQTPQTLPQQGLAGGMPTSHLTPPDPRFLQRTVPPPALHHQQPQQPQQLQSQSQQRQPHHQFQPQQLQAPRFPWLDQQPHRHRHQQSQPKARGGEGASRWGTSAASMHGMAPDRRQPPQATFDLHARNVPAGLFADFEELMMNAGAMRVDRLPTKGTADFALATVRFPTREEAEKALQEYDTYLLGTRTLELTRHNRCPQWGPEDLRSNTDAGTTFFVFLKNIARGYERSLTQHVRRLDGYRRVHVTFPSGNESIAFANVSFASRETADAAIANLNQLVLGERPVEALPNTKQGAYKDDPEVMASLKPSQLPKPERPRQGQQQQHEPQHYHYQHQQQHQQQQPAASERPPPTHMPRPPPTHMPWPQPQPTGLQQQQQQQHQQQHVPFVSSGGYSPQGDPNQRAPPSAPTAHMGMDRGYAAPATTTAPTPTTATTAAAAPASDFASPAQQQVQQTPQQSQAQQTQQPQAGTAQPGETYDMLVLHCDQLDLVRSLCGDPNVLDLSQLPPPHTQYARIRCKTEASALTIEQQLHDFPIGNVKLQVKKDPDCLAWSKDELWTVWVEPLTQALFDIFTTLAKAVGNYHSATFVGNVPKPRGELRFTEQESAKNMINQYDNRGFPAFVNGPVKVYPDPTSSMWSKVPDALPEDSKRITYALVEKRSGQPQQKALPWPQNTWTSIDSALSAANVDAVSLTVQPQLRRATLQVRHRVKDAFEKAFPLTVTDDAGTTELEARTFLNIRLLLTCSPNSQPCSKDALLSGLSRTLQTDDLTVVPVPDELLQTLRSLAATTQPPCAVDPNAVDALALHSSPASPSAEVSSAHRPPSSPLSACVFVVETGDAEAALSCIRRERIAVSPTQLFHARVCHPNDVFALHLPELHVAGHDDLRTLVERFNASDASRQLRVVATTSATHASTVLFTGSSPVLAWSRDVLRAVFLQGVLHPLPEGEQVVVDDAMREAVWASFNLALTTPPQCRMVPPGDVKEETRRAQAETTRLQHEAMAAGRNIDLLCGFAPEGTVRKAAQEIVERSRSLERLEIALLPFQARFFRETDALRETIRPLDDVRHSLEGPGEDDDTADGDGARRHCLLLTGTKASALQAAHAAVRDVCGALREHRMHMLGGFAMLLAAMHARQPDLCRHLVFSDETHTLSPAHHQRAGRPKNRHAFLHHHQQQQKQQQEGKEGEEGVTEHEHPDLHSPVAGYAIDHVVIGLIGRMEDVTKMLEELKSLRLQCRPLPENLQQALVFAAATIDGTDFHNHLEEQGAKLHDNALFGFDDEALSKASEYVRNQVDSNVKDRRVIHVTGMQYRFLDSRLLETARGLRVFARKPSADERDACAQRVPIVVEGLRRQLNLFDNEVRNRLTKFLCKTLTLPVIEGDVVDNMDTDDVAFLQRKLFNYVNKASRELCRREHGVVSYVAPQHIIGTPSDRNLWMVAGDRTAVDRLAPRMVDKYSIIKTLQPTRRECKVPLSVPKDVLDEELKRLRGKYELTGVLIVDSAAVFEADEARRVLVQSLLQREADACSEAITGLLEHAHVDTVLDDEFVRPLVEDLPELEPYDALIMARCEEAMTAINHALAQDETCARMSLELLAVTGGGDKNVVGTKGEALQTHLLSSAVAPLPASSLSSASFRGKRSRCGSTTSADNGSGRARGEQRRSRIGSARGPGGDARDTVGSSEAEDGDNSGTDRSTEAAVAEDVCLVLRGPRLETPRAKEVAARVLGRLLRANALPVKVRMAWHQYHTLGALWQAKVRPHCELMGVPVNLILERPPPTVLNVRRRVRRKGANLTVEIREGNITNDLDVAALVNSANPDLRNDGGVALALSQAAGLDFDEQCAATVRRQGPLKMNEVRVTTSGALKELSNGRLCSVLHVLAPNYSPEHGSTPVQMQQALYNAYEGLLKAAVKHKIRSLTTCALGCGAFGCSPYTSAQTMFQAIDKVDPKGTHFDTIRVTIIGKDTNTMGAFRDTFDRYYRPKVKAGTYEALQKLSRETQGREVRPEPIHNWHHSGTLHESAPRPEEARNRDNWVSFNHDATLLVENAYTKYEAFARRQRRRGEKQRQWPQRDDGTGGDGGGPSFSSQGGVSAELSRDEEEREPRPEPFGPFPVRFLEAHSMSRNEADAEVAAAAEQVKADREAGREPSVNAAVLQRWLEYKNRHDWRSRRFFKFKIEFTTDTPGKNAVKYYTIDFQDRWVYVSSDKEHLDLRSEGRYDTVAHTLHCTRHENPDYHDPGAEQEEQEEQEMRAKAARAREGAQPASQRSAQQAGGAAERTPQPGEEAAEQRKEGEQGGRGSIGSAFPGYHEALQDSDPNMDLPMCVLRGMASAAEACKNWLAWCLDKNTRQHSLPFTRTQDLEAAEEACRSRDVFCRRRVLEDGRTELEVRGYAPSVEGVRQFVDDLRARQEPQVVLDIPSYWYKGYLLPVVEDSDELATVAGLLKPLRPRNLTVQRVQNRPLFKRYLESVHRVCRKHQHPVPKSSEELASEGFERRLLHGTRNATPDAVCRSELGLTINYANHKGAYGPGLYFSSSSKFVLPYGHHRKGGRVSLLVARVLTGVHVDLEPDSSLRHPPAMPTSTPRRLPPASSDTRVGRHRDGSDVSSTDDDSGGGDASSPKKQQGTPLTASTRRAPLPPSSGADDGRGGAATKQATGQGKDREQPKGFHDDDQVLSGTSSRSSPSRPASRNNGKTNDERAPAVLYDSVRGYSDDAEIFVIYDNGLCYPEYIVTFDDEEEGEDVA